MKKFGSFVERETPARMSKDNMLDDEGYPKGYTMNSERGPANLDWPNDVDYHKLMDIVKELWFGYMAEKLNKEEVKKLIDNQAEDIMFSIKYRTDERRPEIAAMRLYHPLKQLYIDGEPWNLLYWEVPNATKMLVNGTWDPVNQIS